MTKQDKNNVLTKDALSLPIKAAQSFSGLADSLKDIVSRSHGMTDKELDAAISSMTFSAARPLFDELPTYIPGCVWAGLIIVREGESLQYNVMSATDHWRSKIQDTLDLRPIPNDPSKSLAIRIFNDFDDGEIYYSNDIRNEMEFTYPEMWDIGIRSCIVVPVAIGGRKYGVISLLMSSAQGAIDGSIKAILNLHASFVSVLFLLSNLAHEHLFYEKRLGISMRIMGHELGTPIRSLFESLSGLKNMPWLTSDIQGRVDDISSRAKWIEGTVNSIHYLGNFLASKTPRPLVVKINLLQVIEDLVQFINVRESAKSYQTKPRAPHIRVIRSSLSKKGIDSVETDETILRHVITILLDNAVKYSEIGSEITIFGSGPTAHIPGKSLVVRNKALELSEDELPRIFEMNYRGSNSNIQAVNGEGMGLWIAKESMKRLGGDIGVIQSGKYGGEFSFYVTFS